VLDGRLRSRAVTRAAVAAVALVALVALVVGGGACSGGGSGPSAPATTTLSTALAPPTTSGPAPATTATPVLTAVPTTVPTTGLAGEVTIRGAVLTVFASARVLQIDPPVDGYSRVALTSDTEYRTRGGSPASLQDVDEGSTVEVTGSPGSPGTLLARLVVVG